jgi:hypothetical protein
MGMEKPDYKKEFRAWVLTPNTLIGCDHASKIWERVKRYMKDWRLLG